MIYRIVFSTDSIERGGKERMMAILAADIIKSKHMLIILAKRTGNDNNYFKEYQIDNQKVELYDNFFHYRNLIRLYKPDLVLSWDGMTSLYNLLLYRGCSFQFINGSIRHGIRLFIFSHLLRSLICGLSPYIIANSVAGLRANNLKPGKTRFVLHNGVESKFLNRLTKAEVLTLRNQLIPGYSENPGFVYVTVANFVLFKDYSSVFKALDKLRNREMFYYLILGDGPLRSDIEGAVIRYKLNDRVFMVGRTGNVRDYLFASDMMIHSSRGEGISNAILEGMYAGLPVIATNVGGVTETVFPGSSMLFPYKNYEALYQCLLKAPELIVNFDPSTKEYQAHLKEFSEETMVERFKGILNNVMKGRLQTA